MSEAQLNYLKFARKYIRSKITKKCNSLSSEILGNTDLTTCKNLLTEIRDLKDEIKASNKEVSNLIWIYVKDESLLNKEMEEVDTYNQKLTTLQNILDIRVSELTQSQVNINPTSSNPPT